MTRLPFPVVGIGASAGGLEALEEFFRNTPADPGMAYVVVQHLSPEHQSLLAQILARHTAMPVHQITDGMSVAVNEVYVIAPGFTLTLKHGRLRLGDPVEKRGHRRPVDDFLRSLAEEQQERAIAVILSGTGTNGTAGAQAIKAGGGICIAQSPDSAAFPGMPKSLIHAGLADQVLEAARIPAVLIRYIANPYVGSDSAAEDAGAETSGAAGKTDLRDVLAILRSRTRHDFSGYRQSTLLRRIRRRMGLAAVTEFPDYAVLLRERADEVAALANDLMINVTAFFRDPRAWEALRTSVIEPLCDGKGEQEPIRAWVTACASGEEAYTLAILIAEHYRTRKRAPPEIKIFATDMSDRSLALARAGVFPGGIEADVPAELLERYFENDDYTFRVKQQIRDMVVFAPHDMLRDPPFSRMDLCSCRNLLIYLEPATQRRVLSMLYFALRTGGCLFLGNTEGCGEYGQQFELLSRKWRIFRKAELGQHRFTDVAGFATRPLLEDPASLPVSAPVSAERPAGILLLQRAMLERYGPPTVVVDRADQIVYFHGVTEPFLHQPPGEPTRDLLHLLKPELRLLVQALLRGAIRDNCSLRSQIDSAESGGRLEITAEPVIPGRAPDYFLVSFRSLPADAPPEWSPELTASMRDEAHVYEELRLLRRELQHTVEAYEATSEELKASNEEASSVNEELQSANEELETSKEELQAVNEELNTVNSQLQTKIAQLEATTTDVANLLSSTNIAVLFLDRELRVRRFTPAVSDLLRLIESDLGRPVTDLALKFTDAHLLLDVRAVLSDPVPIEREVVSHAGRRYQRRALPYRTSDHRVAGIVITFIDVSGSA